MFTFVNKHNDHGIIKQIYFMQKRPEKHPLKKKNIIFRGVGSAFPAPKFFP